MSIHEKIPTNCWPPADPALFLGGEPPRYAADLDALVAEALGSDGADMAAEAVAEALGVYKDFAGEIPDGWDLDAFEPVRVTDLVPADRIILGSRIFVVKEILPRKGSRVRFRVEGKSKTYSYAPHQRIYRKKRRTAPRSKSGAEASLRDLDGYGRPVIPAAASPTVSSLASEALDIYLDLTDERGER